jgi:hypothetical protein
MIITKTSMNKIKTNTLGNAIGYIQSAAEDFN